MLQDLVKNCPYFQKFEIVENIAIVVVRFPQEWKVFPSKDNLIKVTKTELIEEIGVWYYFADINYVQIETIFEFINETAAMNISARSKLELLKTKMEELKEFFAQTDYEDLTYLKFTIDKPANLQKENKPKRKYVRKANNLKNVQNDGVENLESVQTTPTDKEKEVGKVYERYLNNVGKVEEK
jgi:hypothetical protein